MHGRQARTAKAPGRRDSYESWAGATTSMSRGRRGRDLTQSKYNTSKAAPSTSKERDSAVEKKLQDVVTRGNELYVEEAEFTSSRRNVHWTFGSIPEKL